MKITKRLSGVAAAIGLGLLALTAAPAALAAKPILIGVQAPITGQYANEGQGIADAVKLIVKHYPIPGHRFAYPAAMAALAAANQGKFWEFHAALLQNHNALNDEKIREIAGSLKLDRERFEQDLNSPQSHERILQDMQEGQEMDVRGTPTLFLNGKKLDNRDFRRLPDLIDAILAGEKPAAAAREDAP